MGVLFTERVFSQGLSGTSPAYTGPEWEDLLGSAERYLVQVRATQVTGSNPTLTVAIEHSVNGYYWETKRVPINAVVLAKTAANDLMGDDPGPTTAKAGCSRIRLNVSLADAGAPGANIEIWVTGRDDF